MRENFEQMLEPNTVEGAVADWRAVVSAWLGAVIFLALFATAYALPVRHHAAQGNCRLAGAEIPRHDRGVPGPDEIAASDWLRRVQADAYSGW